MRTAFWQLGLCFYLRDFEPVLCAPGPAAQAGRLGPTPVSGSAAVHLALSKVRAPQQV